jgi:hypothetical protein
MSACDGSGAIETLMGGGSPVGPGEALNLVLTQRLVQRTAPRARPRSDDGAAPTALASLGLDLESANDRSTAGGAAGPATEADTGPDRPLRSNADPEALATDRSKATTAAIRAHAVKEQMTTQMSGVEKITRHHDDREVARAIGDPRPPDLDELRSRVTDVLGVPDNAAKALLEALAADPRFASYRHPRGRGVRHRLRALGGAGRPWCSSRATGPSNGRRGTRPHAHASAARLPRDGPWHAMEARAWPPPRR